MNFVCFLNKIQSISTLLGLLFVYEYEGQIVNNCKIPSRYFERERLLGVSEIIATMD